MGFSIFVVGSFWLIDLWKSRSATISVDRATENRRTVDPIIEPAFGGTSEKDSFSLDDEHTRTEKTEKRNLDIVLSFPAETLCK